MYLAGKLTKLIVSALYSRFYVSVGLSLAIVFSVYLSCIVVKPMKMLESNMALLAEGDLSIALHYSGTDEVGRMVKTMSNTVHNLHNVVEKISVESDTVSMEVKQLGDVANSIGATTKQLSSNVEQIKMNSVSVTESTANAMQELAKTSTMAQDTAEISQNSADLLNETTESFRLFQGEIETTAKVTQELAETAQSITTITNTFRDICEQTNLLALNAAIEAAQAGEQGRGFAVVADEVRNLATRADSATDDITKLIGEISSKVNRTVEMLENSVGNATANIEKLQIVANTSRESGEQTISMEGSMMTEQQSTVEEIQQAVDVLVTLSLENSSQASMLHNQSDKLSGASDNLGSAIHRFKL